MKIRLKSSPEDLGEKLNLKETKWEVGIGPGAVEKRFRAETFDRSKILREDGEFRNESGGAVTASFEDAAIGGPALFVPVSHYFKNNGAATNYGKNWHLNLEQRLESTDSSLDANLIYTDEIGNRHGFEEQTTDTGWRVISRPECFQHIEPPPPRSAEEIAIRFLTDGKVVKGFRKDGKLVSISDACGQTVMIVYGAEDRIESLWEGGVRKLTFRYDDCGRLISISDACGRTNRYGYGNLDLTGNLNYVIFADGREISFTYDTQYSFDMSGDLTEVEVSDSFQDDAGARQNTSFCFQSSSEFNFADFDSARSERSLKMSNDLSGSGMDI